MTRPDERDLQARDTAVHDIEVQSPELARLSVDLMWENPFWQARFGDRGRAYAVEDAQHHVTWLCESLRLGSPAPLSRYALWLRGVLTTRGMCTRHLADHLRALGQVLGQRGLDPDSRARALLEDAIEGLRYRSGEPAQLELVADQIAKEAARSLYAAQTEETSSLQARCEDDLRYHLSYLADALAHERPELFRDYVVFVREFLARYHVSPGQLDDALRALASRVPAGRDVLLGVLS